MMVKMLTIDASWLGLACSGDVGDDVDVGIDDDDVDVDIDGHDVDNFSLAWTRCW